MTFTITFIRAGMSEPGHLHIMNFRRQVYINPEDVGKVPESINIEYDNTKYWIFFQATHSHALFANNLVISLEIVTNKTQ